MKYLLILPLLLVTACAGIKARENVQLPVMREAYTRVVQPHIQVAIDTVTWNDPAVQAEAQRAADGLGDALVQGDREAVIGYLDVWRGLLVNLAVTGVNIRLTREELGPNGAGIIIETMRQFDANMTLLAAR